MSPEWIKLLEEALRAGSYSTAPKPLKEGCEYFIEDIGPTVDDAFEWALADMTRKLGDE